MAQNELVTDIVSESAYKQISRLRTDIKDATAEMVAFSKAGKDAFSGITASQSLIDLVNGVKAAADANKGAILAQQQYNTTLEKASAIMAGYGKEAKEYTDILKRLEAVETEVSRQRTEAAKQETEASKQAANAKVAEAKTRQINAKTALEEEKAIAFVNEQKVKAEKLAAREEAQAKKLQSAYSQLSKEYNTAAREAQDLGAQYFKLEQQEKELMDQIKLSQNAGLDTTALTAKLHNLSVTMENVGVNAKAAQDKAAGLAKGLLDIDQAVGKSQRNVGNYNGAAFALSQILREMPSFAFSASTGILALSNNIPMFVDEISRLSAANKALKAEGKETIPVWKTLTTSLFSFNNVLTIGIAIFTIVSARMAMAKNNTKEAADAMDTYKKSIESTDKAVGASVANEKAHAETLLSIAKNTQIAMDIRLRAVDDLQKKYPDYLGNLSKEAILAGNTADAMERMNKAMMDKAIMESYIDKIGAAAKAYAELNFQLNDLSKRTSEQLAKSTTPQGRVTVLQLGAIARDKITVQMDQLKKEMQQYQDLANVFAQSAAPVVVGAGAKDKQAKGRTPKDNTLRNENDLTKELYDEYAKRLLLEAEYQKAIYTDETKTLEERLMAYRQYQELTFQAQTEALSAQYDNLDNSLKEIERIEAKSADKRTQQEKDLLGKKSLLLQQYNNISAEYDLKEKQHIEATAKGIVDLQQNEVNKRLAAIKDLVTNVDIQEGIAMKNLSDKFLAGEIKYKEYTDGRKKIEDQFQKDKYQQIIDYLSAEIAALAATGVNTRALQDELNKAQAALYAADLKAFEDTEKKKVELKNTLNQKIWEAVDTGINTAKGLLDGYYQRQLDHEQSLLDAIEERKNAEIDAVNGQMLSADETAKKISAINAQAHAQEKAIQNEMKRIKREQAIADRVAAILGVVEGVAKAEAANLINFTYNPAYAAGIAALIAGIGAAQIATILATPLPVYGDGTGDKLHPGGGAVLGDKYERELVEEPGKAPYWSANTPTYYDLKAGTKVTPERLISEHDLLAAQMGFMTPSLISGITVNSDYKALEETMKTEMGSVRDAINNKPVPAWITTNGEMRKIVTRGNSTTEYINSNFYA